MQFKLRAHWFVLEWVVILNVVDKFLQEIALVIGLQNVVVVSVLTAIIALIFPVKLVVERLHVVLKIQNFNNIGFTSLPCDFPFMAIWNLLVSELRFVIFTV